MQVREKCEQYRFLLVSWGKTGDLPRVSLTSNMSNPSDRLRGNSSHFINHSLDCVIASIPVVMNSM